MSLRLRFRDDKAAQVAALLLAAHGRSMGVHQLVKLVYLVDREGLIRHGRPITYDAYVSMEFGPVPSSTLNLANRDLPSDMWARLISERHHNDLSLIVEASEVPTDRLSKAERDLISEVYQSYGHMDFDELTEFTHNLPEYHDPGKSSLPISVREILRSAGYSDEDIREIVGALRSETVALNSLDDC